MRSIKRRGVLTVMFALSVGANPSRHAFAAPPTPDDTLAHLRSGHRRLLMTDQDLTTALAAAKTDPLRAELNQHIVATAESILTAPPVRQPDQDLGQEQDRYAVYYILTKAMAYRLTGDALSH